MTMEGGDNQFKITCKSCNVFVTCKGRSRELIYITFLHVGLYTLGIYTEYLDPDFFTFSGLPEQNAMHVSEVFICKLIEKLYS